MSVAANRYATALIDVLFPDKAEIGLQQLQEFASMLKDQPDSRRFLENPTMAGERRNRVLKQISEVLRLERPVAVFISILANRNRLTILEEIISEYQRLMDRRMGIIRARVTASRSLDPKQQQELVRKIEQVTGKQVRMEVAVDPSLIGGVVAQVGSTIYDGSVRQQLRAVKTKLMGE
jgi:F-type H+-transporting ATPase subunit delta